MGMNIRANVAWTVALLGGRVVTPGGGYGAPDDATRTVVTPVGSAPSSGSGP